MLNKQIKKKVLYVFFALLLFAVVLLSGWCSPPSYAYTVSNTSALTDLQKDSAFNLSDYPENANDYSINVIQIAETTDGELLIYTYQPCQKTTYLVATKINMSLTDRMGDTISSLELSALADIDKPKIYDLILISCDGVFCKYVVCDFTVSKNISRYYNISSIYREAISEDGGTGTSNILSQKAYEVGQLWTAITYNGNVGYSKTDRMVVTILPEQMYTGYVRYLNGTHWTGWYDSDDRYCDAWYVAFDCDWQIDDLYEADVVYSWRSYDTTYSWWGLKDSTKYGEWNNDILVTVERDTTVKNELDGWFGRQHEWQEIQSVAEFMETEDLKDDAQGRLKNKQWVLRYALTEFQKTGYTEGVSWHEIGTEIANVSILRLLFKSDGKIYNLGVVNSMQTPAPDAPPDNNPDIPDFSLGLGNNGDFWSWLAKLLHTDEKTLKMIAAIIVTVFVVALVVTVLSALSPVFAPFKAVGKLFKKRKK